MTNKFTVNGKEYKAKAFDFNLVCDLEEVGVNLQDIVKKPVSTARAYFSICSGLTSELAGKEMESHIIAGGNLDCVTEAMAKEMEKSDFFQNLGKNA